MRTIEETSDGNLIVRIPMTLRKRAGRRRIIVAAEFLAQPQGEISDKVLQAFVRAKQWQKDIDEGTIESPGALSAKLGLDRSYVSRILHLNEISPKVVRMVMHGDAPDTMSLERLAKVKSSVWEEQERELGVE